MAFVFHNLFFFILLFLLSLLILPGSDPIWCGSAFSFATGEFYMVVELRVRFVSSFYSFFLPALI
jgi:hypothetical protein